MNRTIAARLLVLMPLHYLQRVAGTSVWLIDLNNCNLNKGGCKIVVKDEFGHVASWAISVGYWYRIGLWISISWAISPFLHIGDLRGM